uniref:Uncharacterized protein n=1 Tax=Setaria viridis TaxID=4556 RepID=A0A4U6VYZ6_SETVI|nr:hypothetical protein SEVIR_2G360650v2 [Setaria viridis]
MLGMPVFFGILRVLWKVNFQISVLGAWTVNTSTSYS